VVWFLPHRDVRRWEIRVGEVANGYGDVSRKTFVLPVDGLAARRTKMESHCVAAFGCSRPCNSLTGETSR
jgi:hypothetical protein